MIVTHVIFNLVYEGEEMNCETITFVTRITLWVTTPPPAAKWSTCDAGHNNRYHSMAILTTCFMPLLRKLSVYRKMNTLMKSILVFTLPFLFLGSIQKL